MADALSADVPAGGLAVAETTKGTERLHRAIFIGLAVLVAVAPSSPIPSS